MTKKEFENREKDLLERESAVLAEYIRIESKWVRALSESRRPVPLDDAAMLADMERRIKTALLRDLGWRARFKRRFWCVLTAIEADDGGWPTLVAFVIVIAILFFFIFT